MKLCVLEKIRLTFDFYLRYLQTGCRNKLQESVAYVKKDDYYLINASCSSTKIYQRPQTFIESFTVTIFRKVDFYLPHTQALYGREHEALQWLGDSRTDYWELEYTLLFTHRGSLFNAWIRGKSLSRYSHKHRNKLNCISIL
jgi:hypothetical protein